MAYQIIAELFAERELRLVRVPFSNGGKKRGPGPESDIADSSPEPDTFAPQYGAGGSDPSSGLPDSSHTCLYLRNRSAESLRLSERKFGRKSRESLRRSGIAAESLGFDQRDWWFLTLTYPAGLPEAPRAIANNSGWVVKQLKNFMRKFEDGESTYFYCWERQKRGVLHLHFGCHLPVGRDRGFCNRVFHAWAVGHLDKLSSRSGCNLWIGDGGTDWRKFPEVLRATAEPVRKGVARYLSKYASKESTKHSVSSPEHPAPIAWWGRSTNLKKRCDELTVRCKKKYESWLAAKNKYEDIKARVSLSFPASDVYVSSSPDCDSDCLSIFRNEPCKVLRRFWISLSNRLTTHLRTEAMTTAKDLSPLTADVLEVLRSQDWMEDSQTRQLIFGSLREASQNWKALGQFTKSIFSAQERILRRSLNLAIADSYMLPSRLQSRKEKLLLKRLLACLHDLHSLPRETRHGFWVAVLEESDRETQKSRYPDTRESRYLQVQIPGLWG